ncbi:MAG: hypothetical protein E2O77_00015 [Caldithrix sp.]|nr:MAG: hypothetical protein E2O77_00015 [Caldithrix sp.]
MTNRIKNIILSLTLLPLLGGCASMAEGVTRGLMGDPDKEKKDTRSCNVSGHTFKGIEPNMVRQEDYFAGGGNRETRPTLKVLMIHGIGYHDVGYSGRFSANLMRELKLDAKGETTKRIDIAHHLMKDQELGFITVSRYFNNDMTREMIFYELVWSNIIEKEKSNLKYDDSSAYTHNRADINKMMKSFVNSVGPDPFIYRGNKKEAILKTIGQGLCWVFSSDWEDLADHQHTMCDAAHISVSEGVQKDDYAIVTHSLGSRIVIDSLQALAVQAQGGFYGSVKEDIRQYPKVPQLLASLQKEEFPIFMFANQLPILQLGRDDPEVTGQIEEYCTKEGPKYRQRLFKELQIMAFSDPNDILSWEMTHEFEHEKLDSRICPSITNVSINIAKVVSLLGMGTFANPGTAHTGYSGDDRVVKLIVHGFGHDGAADLIKKRCTILKIMDDKSIKH